ncbi:MAG: hypothetical protein IJW00_01585 [Clostridia bacterium]|nr:hypothetical protein [Clostridia bacterium]
MKKIFPVVLLCLCLVLSACGSFKVKNPLAYADTSFFLSVRGELYLDAPPPLSDGTVGKIRTGEPLAFSAEISSRPLPAGKVVDGLPSGGEAYEVSITYTSPDALSGLSVTCLYGGREIATAATLTYPSPTGVMTVSSSYGAVKGLLAPAIALLPQGDIGQVSPIKDGTWTVTCQEVEGRVATYHFVEDKIYPIKVETAGQGYRIFVYVDPKA